MDIYLKCPIWGRNLLLSLTIIEILFGISLPERIMAPRAEADFSAEETAELRGELGIIQENSLLPLAQPFNPRPEAVQKMKVIITAYSSTEDQTDSDPFITAAGTQVRDEIIANNLLPFGTKIRIPELYGDKIFIVEDRMSWVKGDYQIDIWFPSFEEALNFGAKRTYIEVLEG